MRLHSSSGRYKRCPPPQRSAPVLVQTPDPCPPSLEGPPRTRTRTRRHRVRRIHQCHCHCTRDTLHRVAIFGAPLVIARPSPWPRFEYSPISRYPVRKCPAPCAVAIERLNHQPRQFVLGRTVPLLYCIQNSMFDTQAFFQAPEPETKISQGTSVISKIALTPPAASEVPVCLARWLSNPPESLSSGVSKTGEGTLHIRRHPSRLMRGPDSRLLTLDFRFPNSRAH